MRSSNVTGRALVQIIVRTCARALLYDVCTHVRNERVRGRKTFYVVVAHSAPQSPTRSHVVLMVVGTLPEPSWNTHDIHMHAKAIRS